MRRERQIEFPKEQLPNRLVTPVCLLLSIVCIVIVVVVTRTHPSGTFIGPWG